MTFPPIISALCVAVALGSVPDAAAAEGKAVKVVVLLESGVGGSQAQGYLDRLLGVVAGKCAWPSVTSRYTTRKSSALEYIKSDQPEFGLMSLGAYLSLAANQQLDVIGEAHAAGAGGRQYFVVGQAASFAECKGKPLASNHLSDPRFVDNVLFHGEARLAEFTLVETPRPVQTLKAVIRGDARCALVDDAQLAQLSSIEGGQSLKTLWKSAELPPMPIVSFPNAAPALTAAFQKAMPKVCEGADAAMCADVGLQRLKPATNANYAALVAAYRSNEIAKP